MDVEELRDGGLSLGQSDITIISPVVTTVSFFFFLSEATIFSARVDVDVDAGVPASLYAARTVSLQHYADSWW